MQNKQTQFNWNKRVVSLANLSAMCEAISGTCHKYWIVSVSQRYVTVVYSNPDEDGTTNPQIACLPCYYDDGFAHPKDNPAVVLDVVRTENDEDDTLAERLECTLFDVYVNRSPKDNKWYRDKTPNRAETLENFIADAAGFIKFSLSLNDDQTHLIAETLVHDIYGLYKREPCFSPRVTGYAKYNN